LFYGFTDPADLSEAKVQSGSEGSGFLIRFVFGHEVIDGIPPVAFFCVCSFSDAGGPLTENGKYIKIPFV
jgi:hypothetical protein